jgi:hypothetical protein
MEAIKNKQGKSTIKLVEPKKGKTAKPAKIQKRMSRLLRVRRHFLRMVQLFATVTAVTLIVYLSATVFLPVVGGGLADATGLSGQTHYYSMLQNWGFPMLFVTVFTIIGNFYICRYVIRQFREFFQSKIDAGINGVKEETNKN